MYFLVMEEWHDIKCPHCKIGLDIRNYDDRFESESDICPNCSKNITVEYDKQNNSYKIKRNIRLNRKS